MINQQRGFTLLEVMIALAIIAIALTATVKSIGSHVNSAAYLKERTLAHWVAMNKVAELQTSGEWPRAGDDSGTVLMAKREWLWRMDISTTEDKRVHRLDVSVAAQDFPEQSLATAVAYLGKPN